MELANDPKEIQDRLRRRYLDRLSHRLRRMRKALIARNWDELKNDCRHLGQNVESFGFAELRTLALSAEHAIPAHLPKALVPPQAKRALELLLKEMDRLITMYSI